MTEATETIKIAGRDCQIGFGPWAWTVFLPGKGTIGTGYNREDAITAARKELEPEVPPTPKVGDGATICFWSDRAACTITAVSASGKTITLREDKATLLNGFASGEADALEFHAGGFCGHTTGTQRYAYEADPNGLTHKATLRKDGAWRLVGHRRGGFVRIGERDHHHDFNF